METSIVARKISPDKKGEVMRVLLIWKSIPESRDSINACGGLQSPKKQEVHIEVNHGD